MIRTILLTGTRAPATLDLARRLWREGLRVVGVDSMRFPLGRFSRAFVSHHQVPPPRQDRSGFLQAIARIAERESVDLIWPTCEEIFHLAAGKDSLPTSCELLCPSAEVLHLLHHKGRFVEWVGGLNGMVIAPESWGGSDAPHDQRLVWKPHYSRFAARTRFKRPPGSLEGWMAQRFIEGREFCSWALCVAGEVRVLTQYQCPARAGRGAGCAFVPVWSEAVRDFTAAVARKLNITGSLAFDFIESDDGRTYVLECNPRLTSGLHVLSPEVRITDVLQKSPAPQPPPQREAQLLLPVLFSRPLLAGSSPDVVAASDDPVPAWAQTLTAGEFIGRALRHRISVLEATTWDIEYNGE